MYTALGQECLWALEFSAAPGTLPWGGERQRRATLFRGEWKGGGGYSQTNQEDPL